ncbi:MAG: hypothetical protein FJ126_08625 [Deltaproteobacteria bacterium]|nr:hypothetical protein [Deltaproteobacteria bacterium]
MEWEQLTPAELLGRIQDLFRELGLFDQTLTLTHRGRKYLARCDSRSFTVYRCLDRCHLSPGAPGWPVCLVTEDAIIDETSSPHPGDDEFASGLALVNWLNLIESQVKK